MKIVPYTTADYPMLCKWWTAQGHHLMPSSSLSPHGVVIYGADETPLCISFLYIFEGADIAQIAWVTANPEAKMKQRYLGINLAIDALLILAKKLNKHTILNFSATHGLGKLIQKRGFAKHAPHDFYLGSL